jgi:hypothetical protein
MGETLNPETFRRKSFFALTILSRVLAIAMLGLKDESTSAFAGSIEPGDESVGGRRDLSGWPGTPSAHTAEVLCVPGNDGGPHRRARAQADVGRD